jgi:hypothetical protein
VTIGPITRLTSRGTPILYRGEIAGLSPFWDGQGVVVMPSERRTWWVGVGVQADESAAQQAGHVSTVAGLAKLANFETQTKDMIAKTANQASSANYQDAQKLAEDRLEDIKRRAT